ncbi:MAG: DNA ligase [Campylobacterota bacterium]|nr:DNA ligase [Campylobacterota bacterium]
MKILILLIPLLVFAKPNILLLETYKEQNITGWVMSEKLDGIRAYWDGKNLITRNGNIINAPKWFLKDYPPFEIDGELWSKRKDFENILSIVRDKIPSENWKEIKHYIFEVPNVEGNLTTRLNKVKPYENNIIKIIPQIKIQNKIHLDNFFRDIISKGGEGVIVRDPTQPYIDKRTRKALKIKSFKDDECKIIGFTDHSKNSAMIGAIKCELDNGVRFKIGSGLNNKLRLDPPNLGDIITFKYQEFTKYGKPRFPVFLRVRDVK